MPTIISLVWLIKHVEFVLVHLNKSYLWPPDLMSSCIIYKLEYFLNTPNIKKFIILPWDYSGGHMLDYVSMSCWSAWRFGGYTDWSYLFYEMSVVKVIRLKLWFFRCLLRLRMIHFIYVSVPIDKMSTSISIDTCDANNRRRRSVFRGSTWLNLNLSFLILKLNLYNIFLWW